MVLKHILCINVTKIICLFFIHSLNKVSTSKNVPLLGNSLGSRNPKCRLLECRLQNAMWAQCLQNKQGLQALCSPVRHPNAL